MGAEGSGENRDLPNCRAVIWRSMAPNFFLLRSSYQQNLRPRQEISAAFRREESFRIAKLRYLPLSQEVIKAP